MTLDQRAIEARNKLFPRYDQLNALWEKVEERLTKHHIPHPVVVEYAQQSYDAHDMRPDAPYESICLSLQKIKGKWRVCQGSCDSREESWPLGWTPIIECSAEIRVAAAPHWTKLEKRLIEETEKFIPKVDEAIAALTESLGVPSNIQELLAERAKLNGKPK